MTAKPVLYADPDEIRQAQLKRTSYMEVATYPATASHVPLFGAPDANTRIDAARYRWLRDNLGMSLSLSLNDHATTYTTARQWIEQDFPEWFESCNPQELERMKDTGVIWGLQVYPDTPVAFYQWFGATLDSVIDQARKGERDAE